MRALLLLAALSLTACGPSDGSPESSAPDAPRTEDRDITLDLGDVDLGRQLDGTPVEVAVTRDGGVEMGLTESVLFVRLSESTRKQVSEEMDAETEERDGLGGSIARAVTQAVEAGLATAAQVPLSEIQALRVADGRLVIEMADGGASPFDNSDTDGEPLLSQFSEADAERLAAAFDRIKR